MVSRDYISIEGPEGPAPLYNLEPAMNLVIHTDDTTTRLLQFLYEKTYAWIAVLLPRCAMHRWLSGLINSHGHAYPLRSHGQISGERKGGESARVARAGAGMRAGGGTGLGTVETAGFLLWLPCVAGSPSALGIVPVVKCCRTDLEFDSVGGGVLLCILFVLVKIIIR